MPKLFNRHTIKDQALQKTTRPDEVHKGQWIRIKTDNGDYFEGPVAEVLTKVQNFRGIKVRLTSGKVGRVVPFVVKTTQERGRLEEFQQNQNQQEGLTLEFKASFLFDLCRYEYTGDTEALYDNPHSVAKTIAAFANSCGGTLYIGIRDENKQIMGLEHDYSILKKYKDKNIELRNDKGDSIKFKSNGEFQTALKRVMDGLFFNKFDYIENTSVDIFSIDGKDLCVIKVKPSKRPVVLGNKQRMEFYVRYADQSELYDDVARFCNYWCERLRDLPD